MSRYCRRDFLKRAAVGGLAVCTIAGTKASARVLGANERVRVAVAGIHGRGVSHLEQYANLKDKVEIVYLVDPDHRLHGPRSKWVKQRTGDMPQCVADLRKILDDKNLDAVSIATPNHWHALLAIWACQAGKDVYVEKPCSHNPFEGRKLVEAATKYDRVVQMGSQSRSDPFWINQIAAVHSGKYGKLLIAYGYASKPRPSIGFKPFKQPPKELDFDIWLGPAPKQPYHENLVHYNWHWFWDFGNGEIGNQGVHQMDIARWAMPEGAVPRSVISLGGRFGYKDQGQTANTQLTIFDFGGPQLFFEDRGLVDGKTQKVTDEFYLEDGLIKGGLFYPKGKKTGEPLPDVVADPNRPVATLQGDYAKASRTFHDPTPEHFANFIDCVRNHRADKLNAPVLQGHLSSQLCHLGNISYRLGEEVPFVPRTKAFGDDKAAYEVLASMEQHLVTAAELKLEDSQYRLGRKLTFDAAAEKFVDDDKANRLLTRAYRAPYVVPENA